jgi:hypothetical protein
MSSPDSLLGHFDTCPQCRRRVKVPDMEAREQRIREARAAFDAEHNDPATERQINYARDIGLEFAKGITKYRMGMLLTRYDRARHYLYALWLYLAGTSATESADSSEFIKRAAVAMLNQDPDMADKVSHLVGGDWDFNDDDHEQRKSEEFLPADPKVRDALAEWMPGEFEGFAHRRFPRR